MPISVVLVYEDELSSALLHRLLIHSGREYKVDRLIPCYGGGKIKSLVPAFRSACKAVPHVVLTDLDNLTCAPGLLDKWGLGRMPKELLFRIAVRESEAWVLADRSGVAHFLGVPLAKVPMRPDELVDPKQTLIQLARSSRKRRLVEELVPAHGTRISIGPLYNQRLSAFVKSVWDVDAAVAQSPSLSKTVRRLAEFMQQD